MILGQLDRAMENDSILASGEMPRVLREAGWPCSAVTPGDDLRWIDAHWLEEVHDLIERGWIQS
jgi:hypothetical protein